MKKCILLLFILIQAVNLQGQMLGGKLLPNQSDSTRIKYVPTKQWGFGIGYAYCPFSYSGLEELSAYYSTKYPNTIFNIPNSDNLKGLLFFIFYKYSSITFKLGGTYQWDEITDNWESFTGIEYDVIKPLYIGASFNLVKITQSINVGATISSGPGYNTYLESIQVKGSVPSVKIYTGFLLQYIAIEGGYAFSFNSKTTIEKVTIKANTGGLFLNFHCQLPIGAK